MLAILSIVSLIVGGFVAGAGAFDWEFLFSDGYREHDWVRSLGRGGARGLLILFGSVLVVVGFVGQVVDAASKPVTVTANPSEGEKRDEPSSAGGSAASSPWGAPGKSGDSASTSSPAVQGPSRGHGAPASPSAAPPPAGAQQPVTIWNPQMELVDGEVIITLQYRFEPGYKPLTDVEYCWIIGLPEKRTEVVYDSLATEGRLSYRLSLLEPATALTSAWSTLLLVDDKGKRDQVSNVLDVARGEARSTPLGARP